MLHITMCITYMRLLSPKRLKSFFHDLLDSSQARNQIQFLKTCVLSINLKFLHQCISIDTLQM